MFQSEITESASPPLERLTDKTVKNQLIGGVVDEAANAAVSPCCATGRDNKRLMNNKFHRFIDTR